MRIPFYILLLSIFFLSGASPPQKVSLVILGIAQDGGYPHAGCIKACCTAVLEGKVPRQQVVCLGLVDHQTGSCWMFEATPDFPQQWRSLQHFAETPDKRRPDGIFLTHAHIGHYTGLMFLGREVMGATGTPVYALPRMEQFLRQNGPWSQLVDLNNITIKGMQADSTIALSADIRVTPFLVPHRDEFSETAGYKIETPGKTVLFIPDIDKWSKWSQDITEVVQQVDIALIDATFYRDGELPGRSMEEVPHPFVEETMRLFAAMPDSIRQRIYFIHFNHSNPLMWNDTSRLEVTRRNFKLATEGITIPLW